MFDPVSRHGHIVKQGDAARQAELLLRDRRVLSLTLEEWRNYLLLFPDDVVDQVDRLQQEAGPGEGAAKFYLHLALPCCKLSARPVARHLDLARSCLEERGPC